MRLFSDRNLMAMEAWQEAEGQPHEGKVAVCEAIRNRERLRYSSDGTVAGTIALRYQFSAWNDDRQDNARLIASLKLDDADPIVQDCLLAADESETSNLTGGAVLYFNPKTTRGGRPPWDFSILVHTATVGDHEFYALKAT